MSQIDWNWIQSEPYEMLINGELTQGSAESTFDIINPATNETIASAWNGAAADVDQAVAAASESYRAAATSGSVFWIANSTCSAGRFRCGCCSKHNAPTRWLRRSASSTSRSRARGIA